MANNKKKERLNTLCARLGFFPTKEEELLAKRAKEAAAAMVLDKYVNPFPTPAAASRKKDDTVIRMAKAHECGDGTSNVKMHSGVVYNAPNVFYETVAYVKKYGVAVPMATVRQAMKLGKVRVKTEVADNGKKSRTYNICDLLRVVAEFN